MRIKNSKILVMKKNQIVKIKDKNERKLEINVLRICLTEFERSI